MQAELSRDDLIRLVEKQITTLFVFDRAREYVLLEEGVEIALKRCEHCFSYAKNKYYWKRGEVYFNPFHSGQYTIFLYFLSREIFFLSEGPNTLSDRIYYLNKCLNGLDLFYEVKMPAAFFLDHPVGSVMGRATYGERFSFSQNCTVGGNKGIYPTFGDHVNMLSGSKVVGKSRIGHNVIIAANTYIKDQDIPSCSLVFGASPNLLIKCKDESYFRDQSVFVSA